MKPRHLGIALIGCGFMGRAHSNAWRQAPRFFSLPAELRLKTICGRDARKAAAAAREFGWEKSATDWRKVLADPEIDLVDLATPNDSHVEIALAAAAAGKAILCEKPLALSVIEAERMTAAVQRARVPNMVCHNYRRVPALALAHAMIARGELGERLFHFRARYAQDWIVDPAFPLVWRMRSEAAGSGSLGDLGSHVIDLARFLVGEFREVSAMSETFVRKRPLPGNPRRQGKVTVDDAVAVLARFRNGAMGTIEATRFAPGRKNGLTLEINGSGGSLAFDLEEMNRLRFYSRADLAERSGFRDLLVTEPSHPYIDAWWPPGHLLGYEHSFVHTIADFVRAIAARKPARPTFADALVTQRVIAAIARSAKSGRWVAIESQRRSR